MFSQYHVVEWQILHNLTPLSLLNLKTRLGVPSWKTPPTTEETSQTVCVYSFFVNIWAPKHHIMQPFENILG